MNVYFGTWPVFVWVGYLNISQYLYSYGSEPNNQMLEDVRRSRFKQNI